MTNETAGREMDARVAEAMGVDPMLSWQVMAPDELSSCLSGTKDECERWLADHQGRFPDSVYAGYHVGAWKVYPRYSTEIVSAWQVVEKLREEWIVSMEIDRSTHAVHLGKNYASIPVELTASGDTAPLAICKARLKALEVR